MKKGQPRAQGNGRPLDEEAVMVWVPTLDHGPADNELGTVKLGQMERADQRLDALGVDLGGLQAALGELADQLYRLHDRVDTFDAPGHRVSSTKNQDRRDKRCRNKKDVLRTLFVRHLLLRRPDAVDSRFV
jgi:hypothetical protein